MKEDKHFTIFAVLWALAALFRTEYGNLMHSAWEPVRWGAVAYTLAALAVLAKPDDRRLFLLLCGCQLVDVAIGLPAVPNHWLLVGAGALTFLVGGGKDRDRLAVGIAVFYLFTGIWKMNTGFADPTISCGSAYWMRLADTWAWLPKGLWIHYLVLGTTYFVELVAPFLLVWRRTRLVTIFGFLVFHLLLGLDSWRHFLNFSTVMFAWLWLLTPEEVGERAVSRSPLLGQLFGRGWLLVWLGLLAVSWFGGASFAFKVLRWSLWIGFATSFVIFWAMGAWGVVVRASVVSQRSWLLLALVLLNGTAPILGWKNRNSWQMYANLRLESDHSNHWFLPPSLDLWGWQADRVTIESTSEPAIASMTVDRGRQLTWLDFLREIQAYPDASVTYVRAGQRMVVPRVGDDPVLAAGPGWIGKLVWFRPIGEGVDAECLW